MDNMLTYYVVWRIDEDDFFVTRLDLPLDMELSTDQYVQMAFDVEYPDEANLFTTEDMAPYDLATIFRVRYNTTIHFLH